MDCKEEACHNLRDEAPQILDYLDDDCKTHFMKVVDYLDELDLPYVLNPYIVRGLDYYTKTIFEYWSPGDEGGKNAFGGGGRYDELVMLMGGREDTPACGLAMGMDRLVAKLRENEIEISQENRPDVFIAQLGEAAKRKTFTLYEKLRKSDLKMAQAFYKDSLKNQLEMANKLKVKITLILGQKEISDGTILIRDMQGGVQEVIDMNKIELEIKKRLEKYENGVPALNLNEEEEAPTSVGNEVGIPTESVGKEPKINNEEKKLDKK